MQDEVKKAITVSNISKSFGSVQALKSVNLEVEIGTIFALLGPNGAGKTTLIRILATLLRPDSGKAEVAGFDVIEGANKIRSFIGLTGQYAALDETLTGRENLMMIARLYRLDWVEVRRRADDLLERFDLTDAADRRARTYSGGMRRKLDLAASLVGHPKILFLDEPTTGLDPRSRFSLWDTIRKLTTKGTAILLTTQYLEEADQLANKIAVIDKGRIVAKGTANELKKQAGGDVLEIHFRNSNMLNQAAQAISQDGQKPEIDYEENKIALSNAGVNVLTDVIRKFDRNKVEIQDISLRRPTLDEVFLTLTGHSSTEDN